MKKYFKFSFISVFLAFALSAVWIAPAFADDAPPPVVPEVIILPEDADDSGALIASSQQIAPESSENNFVAEATEQTPPSVAQEAQPAIEGDPIWCPTGVAPKASTSGCSPAFNRFGYSGDTNSLVDWLATNQPNKAGTIWIEHDYDNAAVETSDIVLSGADYLTLDNFALTIQGGWNGIASSKLLNTVNPYSYFNKSFSITNWSGAITINNIIIDNASTNSASTTNGLNLTTKGNILLSNVSVQGSQNTNLSYAMNGASINNTSGTGTITINNSNFSGNEGTGLSALSNNAITVNGISANLNGGAGVILDNSAVQGKPVTLKGLKQFNYNDDDGLKVYSAGLITLSNLVAHDNNGDGIYLDNRNSLGNLALQLAA